MKVFGVTGWKNAGKTGLMTRLIAEFCARGLTVSTIKHAHHTTDVDAPGRDSHRHREAGAHEVLLASPRRWALMHESRDAPEPPLHDLLPRLSPVDLVLIEGYKSSPHGKVEAWRAVNGKPPLVTRNKTVHMIAADSPLPKNPLPNNPVPVLDLNDTVAVADAIADRVGLPTLAGPHPTAFDTVVVLDWSARNAPSPAEPSAGAIWMAVARGGAAQCSYHRTRSAAMTALTALLHSERTAGRRVLVGCDFPFAYPRGFARGLTGQDDPLGVWDVLSEQITDDDINRSNRFEVAAQINRRFPGVGPFWGCPPAQATADLPVKGTVRHGHGLPERRAVERSLPGTQPCWKLFTTGSVGSQALLGLARLNALRAQFGADVAVRPFQDHSAPIVLAEVFPSLITPTIQSLRHVGEIRDCAQVRILAQALWALPPAQLDAMTRAGCPVEGTILGVGQADALDQAAFRGYRT
ncbi:MAG: molybdopterin-guanine dinucleotide biosynthesis protein B [Paracoccaceae bacterium]